ncbi:MAG: SDR family oxidoreductase [Candidatus Margulisiibacteriota bacterium]|nr:SDR family oxidoreductase [Candidatus Margulisiibacteriota bacterium]
MNIAITGANRGIGLELSKQLGQDNLIYALCRNASTELSQLKNVKIIENVDVKNQESIQKAAEACGQIDVLINNAGILKRVDFNNFDEAIIREQWEVNAMGPLRVTKAFKDNINSPGKVILITSRMGSVADNESGSHYGYRMSKAALNMAGKSMAIDFKADNIAVGIIHPGWVQTDMTGHTGHYDVVQAASQIIDRIKGLSLSNSGTFWHSDGQILPW